MKTISFHVTREESQAITRIVDRIEKRFPDIEIDRMTMHMDLTACHANGCPLDFAKLEAFPDLDFGHDVFGIRRHIDRETGKLTRCFVPRCALH